jgi:hypothetical protein
MLSLVMVALSINKGQQFSLSNLVLKYGLTVVVVDGGDEVVVVVVDCRESVIFLILCA